MKDYIFIFILLSSINSFAQEFRGGEIWFKRVSDINYDVFVDIYLKDTSSIDKPFLLVSDGFTNLDSASLILSEPLPQGIKLLRYKTQFTFLDENTEYVVYVTDTFHLPELKNLEGPNKSIFFLHSFVTTTWYQIFGNNSPPVFAHKQTDYSFNNGMFILNSIAEDPNGDTLFYGLKNYNNFPGYVYDHPMASDSFTCGFTNGLINWNKPIEPGKYLFGVEVHEYRPNGFYLGRGGRDIIVDITDEDIISLTHSNGRLDLEFKIHPNPSRGQINLSVLTPFGILTEMVLTAHNLLGQPVWQSTISPSGGEVKETVDVSTWPPGVYFFTLAAGRQVWSERVVVY